MKIVVHSPPNSIGDGIMFPCCLSTTFVRLFLRTDLVTMISHEQPEQSW